MAGFQKSLAQVVGRPVDTDRTRSLQGDEYHVTGFIDVDGEPVAAASAAGSPFSVTMVTIGGASTQPVDPGVEVVVQFDTIYEDSGGTDWLTTPWGGGYWSVTAGIYSISAGLRLGGHSPSVTWKLFIDAYASLIDIGNHAEVELATDVFIGSKTYYFPSGSAGIHVMVKQTSDDTITIQPNSLYSFLTITKLA